MSWLASLLIALLAAVAACIGSGVVADLCVGWYRMSGREGASGYFVVAMALIGLLAGFFVGLLAARVVAAGAQPGIAKGLLAALGVPAILLCGTALVARVLADIPPLFDGEPLWLEVEVRCPRDWSLAEMQAKPARLTLGALSGRTVRKKVRGVLLVEDARAEKDGCVVSGAAELFTERGKRVLGIELGKLEEWFEAPVPRHPGKAQFAWSDWLSGKQLAVRWRVQSG